MPKILIEKLVFGGQGMGRLENKVAFIWGALPGEEVEFEILKKKKNFIEGVATKILKASSDRVEPKDGHFLSCSPWQTISYDQENKWKVKMAEETYKRIGGFENLNLEIVAPAEPYGYRNKIEFNFTKNKNGELSLAFHHRGTHRLNPIESCALADPQISKISIEIVKVLLEVNVPLQILKSLIVRSDSRGVAAALFVTDKDFLRKFTLARPAGLRGLQIYFSNPLSPASVPTELLLSDGDVVLESVLNGVRMRFGLLSFFQISPPIFEKALQEIKSHLGSGRIVDYYCGVGAISLALHGSYKEAFLVEENAEAIDFAVENIALNGFTNIKVQNALAENANPEIGEGDTVILDPPRTGLHADLTNYLLHKQPQKIIYLSCGLDTHARDLQMLSVKYKPVFWKLFNFFPRTPHIEGLCVMERI